MQLGLVYSQKPNKILSKDAPLYSLTRYVDRNFVGNPGNLKSIMGYCFFFNLAVVL